MNNSVDYLLSNIPFYWVTHKKNYVSTKLNVLKNKYTSIKDKNNNKMSWDVIEYYLVLAYEYKFYGLSSGPGLRIEPIDILNLANDY
jgi:hypothetical protein